MKHERMVRIVPGADTAVLMIHGIVGTPNHFRDMLPLMDLIPEAWSVYNVLLDGHGGSVRDFSRTSMTKWKRQVNGIFRELAESHHRVFLVGHSMGALFCVQLTVRYPDKTEAVLLLNTPLRVGLRCRGVRNMLRIAFGSTRRENPVEAATEDACGVQTTWKVWQYIGWIPRILELFGEINRTRNLLPELNRPCTAFHSGKDELVMPGSVKLLTRAGVRTDILPDSTHFYYVPDDRERIITEFTRMVQEKHD